MKKLIPFILLEEKNTETPFYRQIYEAICRAILKGELVAKARLPSTRDLAKQLGVSRITVVNAYEQLFAEGYLEGKRGSGTFVAATLPDDLLQTAKAKITKTISKQKIALNLSPFGENLLLKELESSPTFRVALLVVRGFDLDVETALRVLREEWNPACEPPWSEHDLHRKVREAARSRAPRGFLLVERRGSR